MERRLFCHECGGLVAVLRDAKVMKGMVAYCKPCDDKTKPKPFAEVLDFIKKLFGL